MTEDWRLMLDNPRDAHLNMAIDESIFIHCIQKQSPPTLRFFQWQMPSITIGYAVDAEKELNLDPCWTKKIPVVRRITGGGAVFHKPDITFSINFPKNIIPQPQSIIDSYKFINQIFVDGLKNLGIVCTLLDELASQPSKYAPNICFIKPTVYDILFQGKKLVGNAQRRKKDFILNHGSILYKKDHHKIVEFLKLSSDYPSDFKNNSISIEEIVQKKIPRIKIIKSIVESFQKNLNVEFSKQSLTRTEKSLALKLAQAKYSTREWNFKRTYKVC